MNYLLLTIQPRRRFRILPMVNFNAISPVSNNYYNTYLINLNFLADYYKKIKCRGIYINYAFFLDMY